MRRLVKVWKKGLWWRTLFLQAGGLTRMFTDYSVRFKATPHSISPFSHSLPFGNYYLHTNTIGMSYKWQRNISCSNKWDNNYFQAPKSVLGAWDDDALVSFQMPLCILQLFCHLLRWELLESNVCVYNIYKTQQEEKQTLIFCMSHRIQACCEKQPDRVCSRKRMLLSRDQNWIKIFKIV